MELSNTWIRLPGNTPIIHATMGISIRSNSRPRKRASTAASMPRKSPWMPFINEDRLANKLMKKKHNDYQVAPYSKLRRVMAVTLRSAQRKPMIHGLIEVDVTRAREYLRDHK